MFVELTNTRLGYLFLQTCLEFAGESVCDYIRMIPVGFQISGTSLRAIISDIPHALYTRATKKTRIKGTFCRYLLARVTRVTRLGVCFRGYTCLGGKIFQKARENT